MSDDDWSKVQPGVYMRSLDPKYQRQMPGRPNHCEQCGRSELVYFVELRSVGGRWLCGYCRTLRALAEPFKRIARKT